MLPLHGVRSMATTPQIPFPAPLKMTGNVAAEWKRFHSQWNNYVVAANLDDQSSERRAAIFLACIGTDVYELFQTLQFAADDDRKKIDKVVEAFERHCIGEINVTYERYMFNRRVQEVGESFDNFLSELRRLMRTCQYDTLEDSIPRDRIVIGIADDATRRKLLQARQLDLATAIDVCRASKIASRQLKVMTSSSSEEVNALKATPHRRSKSRARDRQRKDADDSGRSQSKNRRCKYCNFQHEPSKQACPAYNQVCRKCSKRHHFESVCKSTARWQPSHRQVCQLNADDDHLLTLTTKDSKRIYSRLNVNDRPVRFLLDCGATANVIPISVAHAVNPGLTNLRSPAASLRMFDDSLLKTRGMISAVVQHPLTLREQKLDFYVAEQHKQPILGVDACLQFDLLNVVEENICAVRDATSASSATTPRLTREAVVAEYADLFEGLGTLPGEVHLEIDADAKPVQMPLRRLPEAIKEKVRAELDQMCRDGIIEPVNEPSDWISALLVVSKPDGQVRICIDPQHLNKALKRSHYRMETIQDVLPKLRQAKAFSTIDIKKAFWMVQLDNESSRLTTFETPFCRYRFKRLPFGISPAPELFAAKLQEALRGLEGVANIATVVARPY